MTTFYRLLAAFLLLTTGWACESNTSAPQENQEKAVAVQAPEAAPPVDLVERTEYEADSTLKLVYQVDQNSDLRHGTYREYNALTGTLQVERQYEHGKIEGNEIFYFPSGTKEVVLSYQAGIQEGPFQYFHENGQIKQEGYYKQGKIEGVLKTYYSDGQLKEEVTHQDGVTEGPFKEYNPNGTLKATGAYTSKGEEEDLEQGIVLDYDENGELRRRMACKQGQCCTIWTAQDGDVEPSSDLCKAIIDAYGQEI